MCKTIAVHVRYKSLYISLPSSAKQSEMTKFYVIWGMRTTATIFSYFHLKLNAVIVYLAWATLGVFLGVAVVSFLFFFFFLLYYNCK